MHSKKMAKMSAGDKLKRNTIHTITQASWLGPIVGNMSVIASAAVAMNLGADQQKEVTCSDVSIASLIEAQKLGQSSLLSNLLIEENSGRSSARK
jgi:hypothetical protein